MAAADDASRLTPGPGKLTADAAFSAARKAIATRNEAVQKTAREAREAKWAVQAAERRRRDAL